MWDRAHESWELFESRKQSRVHDPLAVRWILCAAQMVPVPSKTCTDFSSLMLKKNKKYFYWACANSELVKAFQIWWIFKATVKHLLRKGWCRPISWLLLQGVTSIGLFKDKLPETLKHFFFLVPFLEIDELARIKNFQNRNQPDEKNEVWRMSSDG